MAVALGKRKREAVRVGRRALSEEHEGSDESESEADMQEIFRRHFEARFEPLPEQPKPTEEEESDEDDDEEMVGKESEWEGLSSGPEDEIEVVEHALNIPGGDGEETLSKKELRAFMSAKPPSAVSIAASSTLAPGKPTEDDEAGEKVNLKNDLALQRLLSESHLLDSSTSTGPVGKNRHKATDLRLLSLGSKSSILTQQKMPMAHRKGIIAKAATKEETRRREAKEAGVVLEKEKKKRRKGVEENRWRDRGVGGPSVGKFRDGALVLSRRDVAAIRGPSGRGGRGGKGGRGGGGKGKKRGASGGTIRI
ncbi:hypothetical protein K402DRAFT_361068 [Aulographum hederae CBS 113979]|uniref:Protein FAF1 n=1 Tax=Aulographum hederae CBS 113979 TaxID=1176131 RepID=A0A6G1GRK0_9PEZI|nr:hypothetical protein K402DRAFT_361068 [Aulographum hederae CBS 113979]